MSGGEKPMKTKHCLFSRGGGEGYVMQCSEIRREHVQLKGPKKQREIKRGRKGLVHPSSFT